MTQKGRLVYGGSFNPLHAGHLRLALECREIMAPFADGLDFLPCASPPHKDCAALLPFELRVQMIRASIAGMDGFACNEEEAAHAGPSYTYITLECLRRKWQVAPYFIVGSQDYALLSTWREGLRLPEISNLVIVPRSGHNLENFMAISRQLWPALRLAPEPFPDSCLEEQGAILAMPSGNRIFWLPLPRLDVSASRIRRLWLAGRSIACLVPDAAREILNREERAARACWENSALCSK